ncbi:uncharacterized protein PAM68-like [Diospyros lotus]|uniref:uncharacterized protein PAM68-like n=1 Tax=Diospyros lotus TaxID=55363 RepID=UPI002257E205|nr:uncharacterized protein PAM68-like [Diospyros lotus]
MKILICAGHPPTHIPRSLSPWKPTRIQPHPALRRETWKVVAKAEAKGFGGAPAAANIQGQKSSKRADAAPRKTAGRNGGEDDEKIPKVVFERMIGRILFYVGAPMAAGIALLQVFNVVKEQRLWEVPKWVPFLTTFVTFGASALGIAYGTLSASWDPEEEGSVLGFEEAQKNWVEMWEEE